MLGGPRRTCLILASKLPAKANEREQPWLGSLSLIQRTTAQYSTVQHPQTTPDLLWRHNASRFRPHGILKRRIGQHPSIVTLFRVRGAIQTLEGSGCTFNPILNLSIETKHVELKCHSLCEVTAG